MKKLLIIPALMVCLTGASTRSIQTKAFNWPIKENTPAKEYHPEIKIDKLDSLMKKL